MRDFYLEYLIRRHLPMTHEQYLRHVLAKDVIKLAAVAVEKGGA